MYGKGTFYDPRLEDTRQFPVAARAGFANIRNTPDLISSKLAALHFYQLSIPARRAGLAEWRTERARRATCYALMFGVSPIRRPACGGRGCASCAVWIRPSRASASPAIGAPRRVARLTCSDISSLVAAR
jgi:hypothetical protein